MSALAVVEQYLTEVLGGSTAVAVQELVSSDELLRRTEVMRSGFPDLTVHLSTLLADGDLVAAHFRAQGSHLGLFAGVPPTGRLCEASCTAVYRVEDGRIAEAWVTWDTLSLMEQLGAVERVAAVSA
jgi:steroid delta-isomerase-like uncharacterized protein